MKHAEPAGGAFDVELGLESTPEEYVAIFRRQEICCRSRVSAPHRTGPAMQSTVSYFIHDAWVAASSFECPSPPDSLAFCCSTCGEIWARAWVEAERYQFRVVPCERHRSTGVADIAAMPGSILNPLVSKHFVGTGGWANVIEHLPWAVLARELELHITAKELEWQTYPQQM